MKKWMKNCKGFTLIELIIVIAILGILIAIIVPSLTDAKERAERAAFDTQVEQLYNAAVMFTIDYPHTPVIWSAPAGYKARPDVEITDSNIHETWMLYLSEFPSDPTRTKDSTFVVEISDKGEIYITPDTYGN